MCEREREEAEQRLINQRLDRQLDFVGQLLAGSAEELDAVVMIGIVRGGNHHTGLQTQGAGQVGDARRGQRASQIDIHASSGKTGLQRGFQHIARNAGVFANQHARAVAAVVVDQHLAGGVAQPQDKVRGNRRLADFTANAIGAEVFACAHRVLLR